MGFQRIQTVLVLLAAFGLGRPSSLGACDPDGVQGSGALYRICIPDASEWNGDLVVYAHGYVDSQQPLYIPDDGLPGGPSLSELINELGFAYATTSYARNGLAVPEGVADIVDLIGVFEATHGEPEHVYVVGASEGGLVTTLVVERYPDVVDGGLAACGPIGDFREQINYWADFHVLFDYYFPNLAPGDPTFVPDEVIIHWDDTFEPLVRSVLADDAGTTRSLLRTADAPWNRRRPDTMVETVLDILWYNVHATNDGVSKLGGQPFGNIDQVYRAGLDTMALNRSVQRIEADQAALDEIEWNYETTGLLERPLVAIHTSDDPIVPSWHLQEYRDKAAAGGSRRILSSFTVRRYGHCNFKVREALTAFAMLVRQVSGRTLNVDMALDHKSPEERVRNTAGDRGDSTHDR